MSGRITFRNAGAQARAAPTTPTPRTGTPEPHARREAVPAAALRRRCDPATLGFHITEDLPDSEGAFGQERAVRAIRFAVAMRKPGYNVFALGPNGVGKHALVRDLLTAHAGSLPSPCDWAYVEDFAHPAEPRALCLPAGRGRRFVADMKKLVDDLRVAIPAAFDTREYAARLEDTQRESKLRERIRELDRNVTRHTVDGLVEELLRTYADLPEVIDHVHAVRVDIAEHAADFRQERAEEASAAPGARADRRFSRYGVNLLVDHSQTSGAPIVYEDHATYDHLLGRIEHHAELGNLVTDFSHIKPGSLHRANGGFLLLDARDVLAQPHAWTALKRSLLGGRIEMEPLAQLLGLSIVESLHARAIPLDVKVVLFGSREIYYLLIEHDPEFRELFKVEADFEDAVDRTLESEREFSAMIATLARRRNVRPLTAHALARLVEEASRIAGDGRKLSTSVRQLFDLAQEAEHYSRQRESACIGAEDVEQAADAQTQQQDRIRERLLEAVTRKTILIDVGATKVGQVNALAAISLGDFTFGRPTRITATARMGEGRVIDIEREVELGGPLHSKGVLSLTNYLAERYAKQHPLSLSASLVFEQSYGGIEGDSASLAELCALLSAIAEVPVKQSIALTGSVNQWGEVQAIGAVNEKIEGFYDACRALGFDGEQGVIIPRANVQHLMLREDVAAAGARGEFRVYAVDTVDDAMEILTGLPAGERAENGECPEGTLNHHIEQQLIGFAVVAKRFGDFFELAQPPDKKPRPRHKKARRRTTA